MHYRLHSKSLYNLNASKISMAKNTDLHTHSYYSDGQLSPKELVRLAKKRGIRNLALTDHNCVKGVEEALREGKKIGVNVIPAVELESETGEILGYFIDYKNKTLIKALRINSERTEARTKDWCDKLEKAGYRISFGEIRKRFPKARGNINAFYVLHLLYNRGYGKPLKLAPKLWKDPKTRPKGVKRIPMLLAIRLIRKAGGIPVLAHPWIDEMKTNFKNMKNLVNAGLKGIEVNNGDRAPLKSKSAVKKIKAIAKKYNLILTSGSDFHGKELVNLMPGNHNMGKNNCDEKVVEKIKDLSRF